MQILNPEQICLKVVELSKLTGAFIRKEAAGFDKNKIEYKGTSDLVSYVDKESEKQIVSGLSAIFPDAGFITEEATVAQEDKEYKWVIDPLDGTTNFLHGVPPYSVSIALIRGREIVVGVVYEVNLDECFYAWKGGGAYLNGKPIKVSPISKLKDSLLTIGFPYNQGDKSDNHFKALQQLQNLSHGIRRFGSAAVDLSYVACGRLEAYYEFNLKIWDIAAGILIVREAGGKVCDFSRGQDCLDGKELLASGNIQDEVLAVIQEFWK